MVKPGYKQTEIGIIPEEWEDKKLGEIGKVCMCKRIFADQTSDIGEIPFYKIGTFGKKPDAYIPRDLYEEYMQKFSYPSVGDVLISAAGTLGRTVVFNGEESYFQDSNIVWLDIDKNQICNDYLYHYYKVIKWASSEGSTIARLYNGIICDTHIALPDVKEQEQIAAALSEMDELISITEKLIAKKKAIKQGAMQELLTGKKRLPGFHGKWRTETIPEVLQKNAGIKIGPFGSQLKKEYLLEDGPFRVYGQENVYRKDFSVGNRYLNRARFEQLQSCEICTGDFLISTMGTIGKCAIVPYGVYRGIMDSHLVRLRIDRQKILPQYLLHLFSEDLGYLKSQTTKLSVGGIMDGLSTKIINSLEIYYPEDLMEQRTIAEMLSNMDEEIDVLKIKLDKYRQVKQGMMQQLLTGKIRLV